MLPEILSVKVEGGGDVLVPVTPVTTFRDISACVREPGDPLPLLLEDSPLGARVVSTWERPLELLRLWGALRDQVTYSASFTLSRYLSQEPTRKWSLRGSQRTALKSAGLERIDPWELYDLRDELKNLDEAILNDSFNSDLHDSGLDELNDSKERVKNSTPDKNDSQILWTSYNSHSKEDRTIPSPVGASNSPSPSRDAVSQASVLPILANGGKNRPNSNSHHSKQRQTRGKRKHHRNRRGSPKRNVNIASNLSQVQETHSSNPKNQNLNSNSPNNMSDKKAKTAADRPKELLNIDGQIIRPARASIKKEKQSSRKDSLLRPFRGLIESAFMQNASSSTNPRPDQSPSRHSAFRPFRRTTKHPCLSPDSHYNTNHEGTDGSKAFGSRQVKENDLRSIKTPRVLPNYEEAIISLRHSQKRRQNLPTVRDSKTLTAHPKHSSHIISDTDVPDCAKPLLNRDQVATASYRDHVPVPQNDRAITPVQKMLKGMSFKYLKHPGSISPEPSNHLSSSLKNSPVSLKQKWIISPPLKPPAKHQSIERRQNSDSLVQYSKTSPSPRLQGRSRPQKRRQGAGGHKRSYSDPLYESLHENANLNIRRRHTSERRRHHSGGAEPPYDEGMRDLQQHLQLIPDGGEVTVTELREMATRQQQQIENQQQLLVAREQRLKYLKQQEGRAAQVTMEAEKLRRLRERVEAQEAKLRRLRALRGQVDSSCLNAASLSSDLEAMRHLFSEKEKELVMAASKVEELTRQLEDLRQGRHAPSGGNSAPSILQQHHQELDKLRRELLYRNSVNREASARVASQKELLNSRNEEIAKIDKRIAELQQRLHRKRLLNQQLASQISAATQAKQAQLKAVQEKAFREAQRENSADDINAEDRHRTSEELSEFERGKHNPKYQTLPHNTKFSNSGKQARHHPDSSSSVDAGLAGSSDSGSSSSDGPHYPIYPPAPHTSTSLYQPLPTSSAPSLTSGGGAVAPSGPVTRTVHSIPTLAPPRDHALAPIPSTSLGGSAPTSSTPVVPSSTSSEVATTSFGVTTSFSKSMLNNTTVVLQRSMLPPKPQSEDVPQKLPPTGGTSAPSSQQENRGGQLLPSTSLSLSFAQKLNLSTLSSSKAVSSYPQITQHTATQPHQSPYNNKDVENVRALGYPSGSMLPQATPNGTISNSAPDDVRESGGGKQIKPSLPPKPPVPTKPAPPPRQKGDPMAGSTESLHLIGSSQRSNGSSSSSSSRPQVFRYASQNVIMSTYTQQQAKQASSENEQDGRIAAPSANEPHSKKVSTGADAPQDKIHVSINRRIEMPPDFMFPEDETPPSDLLGKLIEDEIARQESEAQQGLVASETFENGRLPPERSSSPEAHMTQSILSSKDVTDRNAELDRAEDALNATIHLEEHRLDDVAHLEEPVQGNENEPPPTLNNNNNNKAALDLNSNSAPNNSGGEVVRRFKKGNLKTSHSRVTRRVSFDPLALLLDASLEGELELVKRTAMEVPNPSAANDEGITALHNAICAGHLDIVTFLVTFGYDVNAQDADGWTPLHCAASCNNVAMVKFLVEHGACVLATTLLDHETAAEKCEQDEEGYDGCSQYLYSVQEKLGIANNGTVYSVYDYDSQSDDELSFKTCDALTILRRGDEYEREWWWARVTDKEGYVPRNLLGLYPRVKNPLRSVLDS